MLLFARCLAGEAAEAVPLASGRGAADNGDADSEAQQAVVSRIDMKKVDVYGFGVVLLELITGQKAMKDVHITSLVRGWVPLRFRQDAELAFVILRSAVS